MTSGCFLGGCATGVDEIRSRNVALGRRPWESRRYARSWQIDVPVTLDLLLIGLVIALEPIPLTTFILVLASKGGARKGAAFIFGWLVSLALVIAATVAVTGNAPPKPNSPPSLAALAAKMAIGVALVLIAVRQRRRMGRPKKPKKQPKWQKSIDSMSPWFAIGLGPLTQPWGLVAAGVAVIVNAKISSWQSYLALFLFCLISTSTYLAMEIYAGFRPDQTQAFLARTRAWIDTHTDQVIIVVSLGLGFWLIGKSIYQVVT
jgi:Sap, sulfolipid-1-addressing protein